MIQAPANRLSEWDQSYGTSPAAQRLVIRVATPAQMAIADMITVYSNIVSSIIETRWLVEAKFSGKPKEEMFAIKARIAREYAHKQGKAIKEIVEAIPGAETDAIWPAKENLARERDLVAHGVWMVDDNHRPIVVWHTKMLESDEYVVGEYFDYERFAHLLEIGRHLLHTFSEFKGLLEQAIEEEIAARKGPQTCAVKGDGS